MSQRYSSILREQGDVIIWAGGRTSERSEEENEFVFDGRTISRTTFNFRNNGLRIVYDIVYNKVFFLDKGSVIRGVFISITLRQWILIFPSIG
jgi:hypothetical protein